MEGVGSERMCEGFPCRLLGFPVLNTATPEGPSDVGILVGKYNAVVCRPEAIWRRKPGMVVCGLHTSPWRHHLHLQHTCTPVPSYHHLVG